MVRVILETGSHHPFAAGRPLGRAREVLEVLEYHFFVQLSIAYMVTCYMTPTSRLHVLLPEDSGIEEIVIICVAGWVNTCNYMCVYVHVENWPFLNTMLLQISNTCRYM